MTIVQLLRKQAWQPWAPCELYSRWVTFSFFFSLSFFLFFFLIFYFFSFSCLSCLTWLTRWQTHLEVYIYFFCWRSYMQCEYSLFFTDSTPYLYWGPSWSRKKTRTNLLRIEDKTIGRKREREPENQSSTDARAVITETAWRACVWSAYFERRPRYNRIPAVLVLIPFWDWLRRLFFFSFAIE